MRKIFLWSLFFCLILLNNCFALDWKSLHEKADKQGLTQSLTAFKQMPASIENNYILGLAYLNQHRDKEAEAAFRRILENDPAVFEAKWGIAETLRRQHKINEAQGMLNEILIEQPEFYPAVISLAYVQYIQMDFQGSARLAKKVIEAGRTKADLSNYTRAFCLYAGAKGMIAHYGGLFSKLINGTAVKSNLEKAEALQPNSAGVLFGLGSFYLLAPEFAGGDISKSEAYLRKSIKIDPNFADAYVRLAQLYKIKGNNTMFNKYLNKALEIDPENELALDTKSGRCKYICAGA
ncbi:MAG: TRAP transporter TatT component family protein [Candidatus Omnitrophica bacterium]|nr:TRAP transporter TatT component family protein [Candidatus Omnitrophota bacterium]